MIVDTKDFPPGSGGAMRKPPSKMTDAEIITAVRSGAMALVPVGDAAFVVVGEVSLDDWEGLDGRPALLIELNRDDAKFVAPQVIR